MAGYPKPAFKVTLDGQDLTERFRPRLISLSLSEKRGGEADQLDIVVHDHDGRMAIPRRDAELAVRIGWQADGLVDKGLFKVDEVTHSGAPDVITIRARSADFTAGMRIRRERSWRATTLGAVLADIAAAGGLELSVSDDLAGKALDVLQQSRESDLALLKRLGTRFDAVASVKHGRLVFTAKGAARSASGRELPRVTISRTDGDSHSYSVREREANTGVTAAWHDIRTGQRKTVSVGEGDDKKRLRRTYASEAEAKAAAQAELDRIGREKATLSYTLALGQAGVYPERPVTIQGLKKEIDAVDWVVTEATHTISGDGGFTTALQMETAG